MFKRTNSFLLSSTLLISLVTLMHATGAQAERFCIQSFVRSGKIVHRVRVVDDSASCPRRFQTLFLSTAITTLNPLAPVAGPQGSQGPQGPVGPQGPTGATGAQGNSGSSTTFTTVTAESSNNSTSPKLVEAVCPAGTVLLSGWGSVDDGLLVPVNGVAIGYQWPKLTGQGFVAQAFETSATSASWMVRATAVCRSSS